jgi:isoleucyl-tRNA synthetase
MLIYTHIDHEYEIRQLKVFKKMVEQGLIYRDHRPVHYSPSSRSALAEAELTYRDDHVSHSVYVSFAVDMKSENMGNVLRELLNAEGSAQLVVWTTTPWTLTANMVCLVCLIPDYGMLMRV